MIEQTTAYVYTAVVNHVVDGDTIDVTLWLAANLDAGFGITISQTHKMRLRLAGINAPEMRTAEGKAARARLLELLPENKMVTVWTVKDRTEKFGRYLAWVTDAANSTIVNDVMVREGHAVPFMVNEAGRPLAFPNLDVV